MKSVAVVPTLCTLAGAFCGFLAIAKGADAIALTADAGAGELDADTLSTFFRLIATSCWLIFLAMVFDALDGRIARMTHQTSDFGAALDSVTDAVTFGAAPALLLKFLYESTRHQHSWPITPKVALLLTVLYLCCALLRLARFTVETEEQADAHDFFHGLPTPAAAGFLCSSMLFWVLLGRDDAPRLLSYFFGEEAVLRVMRTTHEHFLPALLMATPILGVLMVSKVPYIHLVNRYMRGRRPVTYVAQIMFVLILVIILEIWALFPAFLLYVVLCPFLVRLDALRARRTEHARGASS